MKYAGDMVRGFDNRQERNWTAHLVLASEHGGLAPIFKSLEREMYRVLARVDDPHDVRDYLLALKHRSEEWIERHKHLMANK